MNDRHQLAIFTLDDRRFALGLDAVERVIRAVEVTPLPKAPAAVLGVIDVHGEILPVFDVRRRFGLVPRETIPTDQFILARTHRRRVALAVDAVPDFISRPATDAVPAKEILPHLDYVRGVVKFEDGLILIHDLETFLSVEEEQSLEEALDARARQ